MDISKLLEGDFLDIDYFEEKSRGKLKYDFRKARDVKTGHTIKIVYSLKDMSVGVNSKNDFVTGIANLNNDEKVSQIRKNGNLDHVSSNQKILAIIDEETGEKLNEVDAEAVIGTTHENHHLKVGEVDTSLTFKSTFWPKNSSSSNDIGDITYRQKLGSGRGAKLNDIDYTKNNNLDTLRAHLNTFKNPKLSEIHIPGKDDILHYKTRIQRIKMDILDLEKDLEEVNEELSKNHDSDKLKRKKEMLEEDLKEEREDLKEAEMLLQREYRNSADIRKQKKRHNKNSLYKEATMETVKDGFFGELPKDLQAKLKEINKLISDTLDECIKDDKYKEIRDSKEAMKNVSAFKATPKDKDHTGSFRIFNNSGKKECMIQISGHFMNPQNTDIEKLLHELIIEVSEKVTPIVKDKYGMRIDNEAPDGASEEGIDVYPSDKEAKELWTKFEGKTIKEINESGSYFSEASKRDKVRDGYFNELPEQLQSKVMECSKIIRKGIDDLLRKPAYSDLLQSDWVMTCIDTLKIAPSNKSDVGSARIFRSGKTYKCEIQITGTFRNHQAGWIESLLNDFVTDAFNGIKGKIRQKYDIGLVNKGSQGQVDEGYALSLNKKEAEELWNHWADKRERVYKEAMEFLESIDDEEYEFYLLEAKAGKQADDNAKRNLEKFKQKYGYNPSTKSINWEGIDIKVDLDINNPYAPKYDGSKSFSQYQAKNGKKRLRETAAIMDPINDECILVLSKDVMSANTFKQVDADIMHELGHIRLQFDDAIINPDKKFKKQSKDVRDFVKGKIEDGSLPDDTLDQFKDRRKLRKYMKDAHGNHDHADVDEYEADRYAANSVGDKTMLNSLKKHYKNDAKKKALRATLKANNRLTRDKVMDKACKIVYNNLNPKFKEQFTSYYKNKFGNDPENFKSVKEEFKLWLKTAHPDMWETMLKEADKQITDNGSVYSPASLQQAGKETLHDNLSTDYGPRKAALRDSKIKNSPLYKEDVDRFYEYYIEALEELAYDDSEEIIFIEASSSDPETLPDYKKEYNTEMTEAQAKRTLRSLSQDIINKNEEGEPGKGKNKVSQYTANIYANIITKNLLPKWASGFKKFSITLDSYQSFFTFEFKIPTMSQDFISRYIEGREPMSAFLHRVPEIKVKMSPRIFHTMKNPDDAYNFFKAAIQYYDSKIEKYSKSLMSEVFKLNHNMKHLISTTKLSGVVTYPMQLLFVFDDAHMDNKDTFTLSKDDINTVNQFVRNIYKSYAAPEKEKKKIVDDIKTMVRELHEACEFDDNIRAITYLPEAVQSYLNNEFDSQMESYDKRWVLEHVDNEAMSNAPREVTALYEKFGVKKLKKIPMDLIAYIQIETESIKDANDKMMIASYCCSKIEIVEWYIELLEVGSKKYVVPHNKPYLENMRTQLLECYKKIMATPIPKANRPIISVQYPQGYEG